MRILSKTIAIAAGLLMASSSYALMWQDYDWVGKFLKEGESHTGQFKITAPVDTYDPTMHYITSAKVGFSFSDGYKYGDYGYEYVDVWIDSTQIFDHVEVDGTHKYGFHWIWKDLNGTLITDLQDGILNYTVKVEKTSDGKNNDVWLKQAKLKAWGEKRPVPDSGSSAILFGLGMISLFGMSRRFRK